MHKMHKMHKKLTKNAKILAALSVADSQMTTSFFMLQSWMLPPSHKAMADKY